MMEDVRNHAAEVAIVGEIGRSVARLALTDAARQLRPETIRSFEAATCSTISGALMEYQAQLSLPALPGLCSLAVAGVTRGDTVVIPKGRWFISRSGLGAVLRRPPVLINNLAAYAWAVSATDASSIEAVQGAAPSPGPGTFCVISPAAGLGVAAFVRDEAGKVTVLPTEAGHSELIDASAEMAPLLPLIRRQERHLSAEILLSLGGLVAIRNALAEHGGSASRAATSDEVLKAEGQNDPIAREALTLFGRALWRFAGNLALIYGAWDGVFLIGEAVTAMKSVLRQADVRAGFIIAGPYAQRLQAVPAGFVLLEHAELRGAAEALRYA